MGKSLKADQSLDDKMQVIRNAFYEKFNKPNEMTSIWCREVFDEYIVCDAGSDGLFKVNYSVDADSKVTFDERSKWVQVEEEYVPVKSDMDMSVTFGSAVKANKNGRLSGLLVAFSDKSNPDLDGDYFDKDTDFGFTGSIKSPVYLHHCLPVKTAKGIKRVTKAIGEVTLSLTDEGVSVDGELYDWLIKTHDTFLAAIAKAVKSAIEKGKMGWSSGTANHLVARTKMEKSWHVDKWPLGLDATLTPMPAGIEQGVTASLKSIKEAEFESEDAGDASTANKGNSNSTSKKDTTMLTEQEKAHLAELQAKASRTTEEDVELSALEVKSKAMKTNSPDDLTVILEKVKTEMESGRAAEAMKTQREQELVNQVRAIVEVAMKTAPAVGGGGPALNLKFKRGDDEKKAFWAYMRTGDKGAYKTTLYPLDETTAAQGEVLVPDGFYPKITAKRDEISIARAAGAMVIQTTLKSVDIPVEGTRFAQFTKTGEIVAPDENAVSAPLGAKTTPIIKYTRLVKVSEDLLDDQSADLDAWLAAALGRAAGLTENEVFLNGDGSGDPLGALYASQKGADAAAAAIAVADPFNTYYSLSQPYRDGAVWVMAGESEGAIRQLAGNNFSFVATPQGQIGAAGGYDTLMNKRVFNSASMPAIGATNKSLLFGNWEFFTIVERRGFGIRRLNELYAGTSQVGFIASMRIGGTVTQEEAFQHLLHATG